MKNILPTLLVGAFLFSSGPVVSATTAKVYTNKHEGYSLRYPSSWVVGQRHPGGWDDPKLENCKEIRGPRLWDDIFIDRSSDACWKMTKVETSALKTGWKTFVAEQVTSLRSQYGKTTTHPENRLHSYSYQPYKIANYYAVEFTIDASGPLKELDGTVTTGRTTGKYILVSKDLHTVYKIDGTVTSDFPNQALNVPAFQTVASSFRILK